MPRILVVLGLAFGLLAGAAAPAGAAASSAYLVRIECGLVDVRPDAASHVFVDACSYGTRGTANGPAEVFMSDLVVLVRSASGQVFWQGTLPGRIAQYDPANDKTRIDFTVEPETGGTLSGNVAITPPAGRNPKVDAMESFTGPLGQPRGCGRLDAWAREQRAGGSAQVNILSGVTGVTSGTYSTGRIVSDVWVLTGGSVVYGSQSCQP